MPSVIVLDDDPATPPPKRGHSPQFSTHVYCGQTAGWIKMPLGMEVGFVPGDTVLDGDPATTPQKGGHSPHPNFWPTSVVAKRPPISATAENLLPYSWEKCLSLVCLQPTSLK